MTEAPLPSDHVASATLPPQSVRSRGLWRDALVRLLRNRVAAGSGMALIALFIFSRICRRAVRAWLIARAITSRVIPPTLMSICNAVMPSAVPATLKSMSPW